MSFFYMGLFRFPNTIYWKDNPFFIEHSWAPCQGLVGCICQGLFQGSWCYPIGSCIYFYGSIIHFDYCSFEILFEFRNTRYFFISLHLLLVCVLFNLFHQNIVFSFMVKFIPRHFFKNVIENGIFLHYFFFRYLLLVYRNKANFCMLSWYPGTLLKSLISSKNFLVKSLEFSIYKIISANNDNYTSSFLICLPLVSLSYLAILDRTFSMGLNKNDRSGHTCLVHDLRRKAFNFPPMSIVLAVLVVIYDLHYIEVCCFYSQLLSWKDAVYC